MQPFRVAQLGQLTTHMVRIAIQPEWVNIIDFEQRFKDLLTSAQRANVSFYPMDVGGLRTFAPTASMRAPGREPDMASAAPQRLATTEMGSISRWWQPMPLATSGVSPYFSARSCPIMA